MFRKNKKTIGNVILKNMSFSKYILRAHKECHTFNSLSKALMSNELTLDRSLFLKEFHIANKRNTSADSRNLNMFAFRYLGPDYIRNRSFKYRMLLETIKKAKEILEIDGEKI